LLLGFSARNAAAEIAWEPNYEEAAKHGKEGHRDLFVFVNGSDWSTAARAYKKSVMQSAMVDQALGKEFLWLEIDRPDQATGEQKAAAQKNKGFEVVIHSYPGVVLLDAEGRCYGKLEAPQGGVDGLLAAVKQARAAKARRDAALDLAAKASGLERAKHLGAALDLMGELTMQNGRHSHRALLDELKKLDPQDAVGTQRRFTFNPDHLAESQLWPLVREKKFEEALALVDKELKDPRNNLWLRQHLLGLRFYVLQSQERLDEALKVLQQIVQLDPKTDMATLARNYSDNITQPVTLSEAKWKPEHLRFYFADWRLDVSGVIREKGTYEIEFKREDGDNISVRDVALMVGSKELVTVALPANASKLELAVPSLPAGQKPWLKIAAKGQGWFGSRGDILIRKR
jgi:tetratricopeptide (TPR) repeat protein